LTELMALILCSRKQKLRCKTLSTTHHSTTGQSTSLLLPTNLVCLAKLTSAKTSSSMATESTSLKCQTPLTWPSKRQAPTCKTQYTTHHSITGQLTSPLLLTSLACLPMLTSGRTLLSMVTEFTSPSRIRLQIWLNSFLLGRIKMFQGTS
jgi:hypothetical protein